jgi:DNA transposition AAA+ family ATPase
MIPEGTEAKSVTEEQIVAVIDDVNTFVKSAKVSVKALAQAVGYSSSVVSEFLNGKYAGNRGQVAIDLESWLVEAEAAGKQEKVTTFVWTNVAQQILAVSNYCLDKRKIGLIYGPDTSGLGKTMALQAISQKLGPRRCTLVTIDKCDANPTGLLEKICQGMRITDNGTSSAKFGRIKEYLTGRSHLLLIDQIHNLRYATEDKPLYYLTDIYDSTQTAQLWCGTSDMVAYLKRQQGKTLDEPLAQIRRRIFPCVDLMEGYADGGDGNGEPLYTVDQIRQMFSKNRLKLTHKATQWLMALAHEPGSGALGMCAQLVEYAVMLAEQRNETAIDVPALKMAMRAGLTTAKAELILQKVEQRITRMVAAG